MMTRFAETVTAVQDANRVRAIREDEAQRVERQFAPIKAKAARNAKYMTSRTGWLAIA